MAERAWDHQSVQLATMDVKREFNQNVDFRPILLQHMMSLGPGEGREGLGEKRTTTLVRFVRVLALGGWIGALIYFVAVVTRVAFTAFSRDEAGLLVGFTLGGLHMIGLIAATIFVLASLALRKSLHALIEPAVLGVILMAALTAVSQYDVIPRMDMLRGQMGSVSLTPPADPRRAEFDRLHSVSVDLEAAVLVLGLVSLFLAARSTQS